MTKHELHERKKLLASAMRIAEDGTDSPEAHTLASHILSTVDPLKLSEELKTPDGEYDSAGMEFEAFESGRMSRIIRQAKELEDQCRSQEAAIKEYRGRSATYDAYEGNCEMTPSWARYTFTTTAGGIVTINVPAPTLGKGY